MPKTKVTVTLEARTGLARECAKLDPKEEKALAEEGLSPARVRVLASQNSAAGLRVAQVSNLRSGFKGNRAGWKPDLSKLGSGGTT